MSDFFEQASSFDFFQAVRLFERLGRSVGLDAVGEDHFVEREAVHFQTAPSLSFSPGPIVKIQPDPEVDSERVNIAVSFFGLIGSQGVLPQHYTTTILKQLRQKDHSLRDFLDLFHHRLMSLFHRAWEKNRIAFFHERTRLESKTKEDPATRALYSIAGLGAGHLRDRMTIPDQSVLFYSGYFSQQNRTAVGLERLLTEYFGCKFDLQQLTGQWLLLERENQAILPTEKSQWPINTQLGVDVVIGRRIWDVQSKIRLTIGPLNEEDFQSFLPPGLAKKSLRDWVRLYLGMELDIDIQLLPAKDDVPWCRLDYDESNGPRLGWNTWIRTHNFGSSPPEAIFPLD
jgi:type VI secretion system protein ImpH